MGFFNKFQSTIFNKTQLTLRLSQLIIAIAFMAVCSTSAWAFPININPGAYQGEYSVAGSGFTGSSQVTVDLAPGTYQVNIATPSGFTFSVDSNGQVINVSNSAAATASGNTLTFNNTSIVVNPVNYTGEYTVAFVAGATGMKTFVVVPNLSYRIDIAFTGNFFIFVDGTGQITSVGNTMAATASGNTLTFNNTSIIVNPGNYTGEYSVAFVATTTGQKTFVLVPNLP